jgi:hypothetical protein
MKLSWPTHIKTCFKFNISFIDKVRLCFKPVGANYDVINGTITVVFVKYQDDKIFIVGGLK